MIASLCYPSNEIDCSTAKSKKGPQQRGAWNPKEDSDNFNHWVIAMHAQDFARAWIINDHFGKRWPSAHQLWDGKLLADRHVYLHGLHGFGDVVQMSRFFPKLRALGCSMTCVVAPALVPLMPLFKDAPAVFSFEEHTHFDHRMCHVELMELLHILQLMPGDLPGAISYLTVPETVKASMAARMGVTNRPRVGLVWRGGTWDPERWIDFSDLEPLYSCTSFEWWSMQPAQKACEADDAPVRRFHELVPDGDLSVYAAAIANLDLLITADTLAAHIAGAMGVPTWILLKNEADWRWMRRRTDSPWYPSVRLFRQSTPGEWQAPIQSVRAALLNVFREGLMCGVQS